MYGIYQLGAQIYGDSSKDRANYAFDPGVLEVQLLNTALQMLSASEQDAISLATLCYVGGELLSYENAQLTGPGAYRLTNLVRAAYGSTGAAHAAGEKFMRLDGAIFRLPFTRAMHGKSVSIKLQSFNQRGRGLQDLSQVQAYDYTITGETTKDTQSGQNISIPVAGRTITFPFVFTRRPKNIICTIIDKQSGDYARVMEWTEEYFIVRVLNDLVTGAVDQFLTGGTASASSTGDGSAAAVVDGNPGAGWSNTYGTGPHWWKYDLGSGVSKVARRVKIDNGEIDLALALGFDLQASNTGAFTGEEVTLLSNAQLPVMDIYGTELHGVGGGSWEWIIDNDTAYRYYRIYWPASHMSAYLGEVYLSDKPQRVARNIHWTATV